MRELFESFISWGLSYGIENTIAEDLATLEIDWIERMKKIGGCMVISRTEQLDDVTECNR